MPNVHLVSGASTMAMTTSTARPITASLGRSPRISVECTTPKQSSSRPRNLMIPIDSSRSTPKGNSSAPKIEHVCYPASRHDARPAVHTACPRRHSSLQPDAPDRQRCSRRCPQEDQRTCGRCATKGPQDEYLMQGTRDRSISRSISRSGERAPNLSEQRCR
jgi:hypothetical protein